MKSFVLPMAIAMGAAACAPSPVVLVREPPPDVPAATLVNKLHRAGGRHESIEVSIAGGQECPLIPKGRNPVYRTLYAMREDDLGLPQRMRVAAMQPLRFYYFEGAAGGRTCEIVADTVLVPGRTYEVRGGFTYKDGPIPIVTGTRSCRLELVDMTTNRPVPLLPRQSEPICEGRLGAIARAMQGLVVGKPTISGDTLP